MKIVGVAGSLRAGSLNGALLKVAGTLVPEGDRFKVAIMGASPSNPAQVDNTPPVQTFSSS